MSESKSADFEHESQLIGIDFNVEYYLDGDPKKQLFDHKMLSV